MSDVYYLLACLDCGEVLDDDALVMVFASAQERGKWTAAHTRGTGHERWWVKDEPKWFARHNDEETPPPDERDQARAEVARLQDLVDAYDDELYKPDEVDEIERLRGLLGRLEWVPMAYEPSRSRCCPICYVVEGTDHDRGRCWLAVELAPQREQPPHSP